MSAAEPVVVPLLDHRGEELRALGVDHDAPVADEDVHGALNVVGPPLGQGLADVGHLLGPLAPHLGHRRDVVGVVGQEAPPRSPGGHRGVLAGVAARRALAPVASRARTSA